MNPNEAKRLPEEKMSETLQRNTLNEEEWRVLAKQAAHERDPEKLMAIIKALTRALDEKDEPMQRSHYACNPHQGSGNAVQSSYRSE